MIRGVALAVSAASLALSLIPALIARTPQGELTEKNVLQLIKQAKNDLQHVIEVLKQRGVDFDLDEKMGKKLRKAGADDNLMREVWNAGPTVRAGRKTVLTASSGAQVQMSPEEAAAFQVIRNESNPERNSGS
jgi:hypothetical protein